MQSPFPPNAEFSPDGRWVAYTAFARAGGEAQARDTGIFVEPFPATGANYRISSAGQ